MHLDWATQDLARWIYEKLLNKSDCGSRYCDGKKKILTHRTFLHSECPGSWRYIGQITREPHDHVW